MQVSADQLFNQIGRLQVEKFALEQSNAVLAQEVVNLREQLKKFDEGKDTAKPENVTEFPGPVGPPPNKAE